MTPTDLAEYVQMTPTELAEYVQANLGHYLSIAAGFLKSTPEISPGDVVHELWAKCTELPGDTSRPDKSHVAAWMTRVLRNLCMDQIRKSRKRRFVELDSKAVVADSTSAITELDDDLEEILRKEIENMDEPMRAALRQDLQRISLCERRESVSDVKHYASKRRAITALGRFFSSRPKYADLSDTDYQRIGALLSTILCPMLENNHD